MTAQHYAAMTPEQLSPLGMAPAAHAERTPDKIAIKTVSGTTRTWAELNASANQLANLFRQKGLEPGDAVAIVAHNCVEFIETWAACLRAGLRLTPVNWHQNADVVAYVLDNCDARAVIASARFANIVLPASQASEKLVLCLSVEGQIEGFDDYTASITPHDSANISEPTAGSTMLYTSGTTGRPKGVYRATRPAVSQLTNIVLETAGFDADKDTALVTGPLYHAAPLALNLVTPLNAGVTCFLMDKWDAEETLRHVEAETITHTHVVPTMLHRILQLPEETRAKYDLNSLRWILHGAAPCPAHVKKSIIEWLGPIVFEYYSSTEGGGVFIGSEDWLKKPGSVGQPVAGVGIKLVDPDGNEPPTGETGTIYIKAPDTGRFEYYKDPTKTESIYRDNYYTLGDMGFIDEDGFLFLTGRSAELIISGGVNIYPAEIDDVLIQHEAVADAAVIGVPNEEWGEEVKAVVELKPGVEATDATKEAILAFASANLPGFQKPRSLDFIEALPRNAAGKVLRQEVRKPYWADRKKAI